MTQTALIRPAWTPATIALMVLGFMVFWPLGLAMLAYIIWGDRLEGFKADVNRATDNFACSFRKSTQGKHGMRASSGNAAFDDWRDAELARLDEERKASMVSNLLVVLCGDRDAQPDVKTGTLYQ